MANQTEIHGLKLLQAPSLPVMAGVIFVEWLYPYLGFHDIKSLPFLSSVWLLAFSVSDEFGSEQLIRQKLPRTINHQLLPTNHCLQSSATYDIAYQFHVRTLTCDKYHVKS